MIVEHIDLLNGLNVYRVLLVHFKSVPQSNIHDIILFFIFFFVLLFFVCIVFIYMENTMFVKFSTFSISLIHFLGYLIYFCDFKCHLIADGLPSLFFGGSGVVAWLGMNRGRSVESTEA